MRGMVEVTLVWGGEESVIGRRVVATRASQFYTVRVFDPAKHAWLLGGCICYTNMGVIAARFACLWWALLR